jgi:hypothetical protein
MSQVTSARHLYLLPPTDLPIQLNLNQAVQTQIQTAMQQLYQALEATNITTSLGLIDQAMFSLGDIPIEAIADDQTQTKLPLWEVEDYDQYFQVSHIQSAHSDRCLLYGLLTTCHRFFHMLQQGHPGFSPEQVARSRDGFISYAQLLQRVYNC